MNNAEQHDKTPTVETVPTSPEKTEDKALGDVVSDPAHADHVGTDWTDEGGAAPEGPATNVD